jgi:hypothetical protein
MLNSITLGSQHYIQFIKVQTIHNRLQLSNLKSDNYCCVDICTFPLKFLLQQNMQQGAALSLSYWSATYELHQLWHFHCIPRVCCVGWGGLLPKFSVVSVWVTHITHVTHSPSQTSILKIHRTVKNHKHSQIVHGIKCSKRFAIQLYFHCNTMACYLKITQ